MYKQNHSIYYHKYSKYKKKYLELKLMSGGGNENGQVTLQSSDKQNFKVEVNIAKQSETIND